VTTERIPFKLDGEALEATPGQTLLVAAEAAGKFIPHLCALEGLEPFGGCRLCTVLVDGEPRSACTEPVVAGAVVRSDTPELRRQRLLVIELLFLEGRHLCATCAKSGACELQALARRLGFAAAHFEPLDGERALDASHPDLFLFHERCFLCARCLRASIELDGQHRFDLVGRGARRRIAVEGRLSDCGLAKDSAAVSACPVGALVVRR